MNIPVPLTQAELSRRILINFRRLCQSYYDIDNVFSPPEYDWYGDKEGRALLAFCNMLELYHVKPVPCLEPMLEKYDEMTNEKGYFGPIYQGQIHEQQLSGHSWMLRGLCEAYRAFGKSRELFRLGKIFEGLYLPLLGKIASYPVDRPASDEGGVSGSSGRVIGDWLLSTDVGCAFMAVDGLSDYYAVTKDERALPLLDEMIDFYAPIDKIALRAQTHCTLSAARGMLRLYELVGEEKYLRHAQKIFEDYVNSGMTATYQNYNWWGRGNTWTEPCAIVDSLILSVELSKITGEERFAVLARRIWHNGLASAQRINGGAGTDSNVNDSSPILQAKLWEAYFCCTMRFAEGLVCAQRNRELLTAQTQGKIQKDSLNRYVDGDLIYGEILAPADRSRLPEDELAVEVDGKRLTPLVKFYRLELETAKNFKQRVIFDGKDTK